MIQTYQLDPSKPKAKSRWIITCSSCQQEKFVGYSQVWAILAGKTGSLCRRCSPKNLTGLAMGSKLGYKFLPTKRSNGKKMSYVNFWGGGFVTEEGKAKQRAAKLGKMGPLSNAYKHGLTPENKRLRASDPYKKLRLFVFKRDNYTCQECGSRDGNIQMDHIKPWSTHVELRFEASNCRTLCTPCHKKTPTYGNRKRKAQ